MWLWILIIFGSIWLDQLTKWLAVTLLQGNPSVPIIPGALQLTYLENPGAAFGILTNQRVLFLILTAVIVGVMIYLYFSLRNKKSLTAISLGIVVSGAIGNFIDRFMQGTVTDFLDFRIWPIFNIADICICVGLALICYFVIIKGEDI